MANNFIPSGVELVAKNLGKFLSDLNTANKAIADVGSKAGGAASVGIAPFNDLGNAIIGIGQKAALVAAGGIAALGAAVTAVVVSGTDKAADLEQGLANIAATAGKTVDEIKPLKDLITSLALDPNLKVTTDEATAAIQALTKQGLDMTQVLDGAGKATVALSNATGADFGQAASISAGIMKAFNLEAKDLTQVIDGATGVMTNSKFTIDDYGLAFSQAGAVAANLGVSLKDFNTIIAGTASSFSSGSDAGTSFKTLLLRLSAPTDEMKAAMKEYGISLFDAEGNMRSMGEVVGQLNQALQGQVTVTQTVGGTTKEIAQAAERAAANLPELTHSITQQEAKLKLLNDEYALTVQYYGEGSPKARHLKLQIDDLAFSLGQNKAELEAGNKAITEVNANQARQVQVTKELTEAERAKLAETLGGADASRLILSLSKLSSDQFETLSGKVNKTGLAFNSASTRMKTTRGALDILQGIIESIQIQIGDKFLPIVRRVAVAIGEWASDNAKDIAAFFGTIAQHIEATIDAGTRLFAIFQQGGLAFFSEAFGTEGIFLWAQIKELIANVSLALSDLGTAISAILPDFEQMSGGVIPAITDAIKYLNENFTAFAGAVGGIVGAGILAVLVASIGALASPILLVVAAAGLLGAAWATNWGGIRDITANIWATVQPIIMEMYTWFMTNLPIAIQFLSDAWTNVLLPAMSATWAYISTTLWPTLMQVGAWIGDTLGPILLGLADIWMNNVSSAVTFFIGVWNGVQPSIEAFVNFVNTSLYPLMLSINNLLGAVLSKTLTAFAGLWKNILLPALNQVWKFMQDNVMPIFVKSGESLNTGLSPILKNMAENVLPVFKKAMDGVKNAIKEATDFFNGLANAVKSFTLPPVLTSNSPTPFEIALRGIADAAKEAGTSFHDNLTFSSQTIDSILGLNRAIASNANVVAQAAKATARFFEARNLETGKRELAVRQLTSVFQANQDAILKATDQVAKFKEVSEAAGILGAGAGFSGAPGNIAAGGFKAFIQGFVTARTRLQKAQQAAFVQAGRTALSIGDSLNDLVDASAKRLDERVNALQELVDSGLGQVEFEGKILSAVEAQDKLNAALKEQQSIQDDLLQTQENAAKLEFLEKQLNLLDVINKAGLNAKDILDGLTLGLDASIPDIITATNRLVQAMIDQVDKDLQISSPSKVLFEKGYYSGEGFEKGILAILPNIDRAFQRMVAPVMSPTFTTPAVRPSASTVTNYNFNQSVTTGASAVSVMRQYDVMRSLVGA